MLTSPRRPIPRHSEPVTASLAWESVPSQKEKRIAASLRAAKHVPLGVLLGMTGAGFIDTLRKKTGSAGLFLINTKIHRETGGKRIDNVEKIWYNDLLYIGGMAL